MLILLRECSTNRNRRPAEPAADAGGAMARPRRLERGQRGAPSQSIAQFGSAFVTLRTSPCVADGRASAGRDASQGDRSHYPDGVVLARRSSLAAVGASKALPSDFVFHASNAVG